MTQAMCSNLNLKFNILNNKTNLQLRHQARGGHCLQSKRCSRRRRVLALSDRRWGLVVVVLLLLNYIVTSRPTNIFRFENMNGAKMFGLSCK